MRSICNTHLADFICANNIRESVQYCIVEQGVNVVMGGKLFKNTARQDREWL